VRAAISKTSQVVLIEQRVVTVTSLLHISVDSSDFILHKPAIDDYPASSS
jgi:hypothetical protein